MKEIKISEIDFNKLAKKEMDKEYGGKAVYTSDGDVIAIKSQDKDGQPVRITPQWDLGF